MRLAKCAKLFKLGGIPVVGNVRTGAIVGLTPDGAAFCAHLQSSSVESSNIPAECIQLAAYFEDHGFLEGSGHEAGIGSTLASAYLHVTNRCNLDCVACYSASSCRNTAPDPSLDNLIHAISLLARMGVTRLVISGGEPFCRPDLGELSTHAKQCGITTVITLTNGLLCEPDRLSQLKDSVDIISVSFDGASSDETAYIRGSQLFDKLVETIAVIQSIGVHAHILPTIHAKNIDSVYAYIDLAERLGATVSFSLLSGDPAVLGHLMPRGKDLCRLADVMISLADEGGPTEVGDAFSPDQPLRACDRCGAGIHSVSVAADGSIYPCHMLHIPELCLGNAFVQTRLELEERLHDFALPSVDDIETCGSCDKRYICGGGCRARSLFSYGRLDAGDPYCEFNRSAIDYSVRHFVSCRTRGRR